CARDWDYFDYW
nr:immunoglobulin heavy chain junction region [Mus musculus]MBK4196656.1 immunoglobulin heavy chain junction region [Mus musculus]